MIKAAKANRNRKKKRRYDWAEWRSTAIEKVRALYEEVVQELPENFTNEEVVCYLEKKFRVSYIKKFSFINTHHLLSQIIY